MKHVMTLMLLLAVRGTSALAEPYWIAWEGDDWPENQGWTRVWGDWNGQYHGSGAIRTLEDGVLTYDSLFDDGVYDYSFIERPGQIDPAPGEVFVMEWRLRVEQVIGAWDGGVGLFSDDSWGLGLRFNEDEVISVFEGLLSIPITPGVFHQYRLTSANMRGYDLYVDENLVHQGVFVDVFTQSYVSWGDGTQGGAGRHHWDYVRFGVIPEPTSLCVLLVFVACLGSWRRSCHEFLADTRRN